MLFILGIFMALVFQLGPKTKYGESEQNPAFWLRVFLVLKDGNTNVSWKNDVKGNVESNYTLTTGDIRIWLRYCMSFLINGVGFHILVHALPLQVAAQSSLTGVVFRAVGMMYLVDLDDTPGYKLTIGNRDNTDCNILESGNMRCINKAIDEARTNGYTLTIVKNDTMPITNTDYKKLEDVDMIRSHTIPITNTDYKKLEDVDMIPIDKTEPQDARTLSIDKAIDDARDVLKRLEGLAKAEEERHEHTQQVPH